MSPSQLIPVTDIAGFLLTRYSRLMSSAALDVFVTLHHCVFSYDLSDQTIKTKITDEKFFGGFLSMQVVFIGGIFTGTCMSSKLKQYKLIAHTL